jgi:hypothetical protein
MPKAAERALKREARKHGIKPGTRRYGAYVYGTAMRIKREEEKKRHGKSRKARRRTG